jgi:predicted O-methyltransferase YrrM
VRERLLTTGTVTADGHGQAREVFPIAIGPREGEALRDRVITEGAKRTIETGLAFAVSTLYICEGLLANGADAGHVAVDPYQFQSPPGTTTAFIGVGLQILDEAGVRDLIEFYDEESQIVLPRLLGEGRTLDLAFIDGTHRFEGVFLDLIYSGRLLKEGGIVFVDDIQIPGVHRAVQFCVRNLGWTVEDRGEEGDIHRWVVLRTGSYDVFFRPYTEYVDF